MSDFEKAYAWMAPHEWNAARNFTDDPDDPGGATKFGITQHSLNAYKLKHPWKTMPDRVQDLDEDHAKEIYFDEYWIWEEIADDRLATKLFDMGVNLGQSQAIVYLQRALGLLNIPVVVDGELGPKTVGAANSAPASLGAALCSILVNHYSKWIHASPAREKYRDGLMKRAMDYPEAG